MKILIINPPHPSIGSRMAGEHLPPLGLLSIAGPLIDNGFRVELIDADFSNMPYSKILAKTNGIQPDLVLMGHSGSTSAQPIIDDISGLIKEILPKIKIIIGGVYPTYHYADILKNNPHIDYIICGEGEQVILNLIKAIVNNEKASEVLGIVFKQDGEIIKTKAAPIIQNLDDYRIAWELMEGYNYTYYGKRKAVVIQFSRGCPYPCNYCGQSLFWKKWRNRDPQLLADEIEMLHRKYGIEVINFADENPSTNKREWKRFLEAIIAKDLNLTLVGSIRADNIVRDKNHLDLYKKAGFNRFLLGMESYDEGTLSKIKKAGSQAKDYEAIQLLRKHNIISMATYVVGFGEEKLKDFYNSLKQLITYDPDQIQMLYATPHKWTEYYDDVKESIVVQRDLGKWDYKHQVLKNKNMPAWLIIILVKTLEIIMQARPKALKRWLLHNDLSIRQGMRWYNMIGKRVWVHELYQFFFRSKRVQKHFTVSDMWK